MDAKALRDIAVVAIEDGEKVGTVSDILFNIDTRRIQAFVVGSGSFLGGSRRVVAWADVQSVGTDAVMIPSRNALGGDRNEDRYHSFPDLGSLTSLRVVTQSGSYVGPLATVRIDPANGGITDVEISQGGLTGVFKPNIVVSASKLISIGRDVVIIPDDYAGEVLDSADERPPSSPTGEPSITDSPTT